MRSEKLFRHMAAKQKLIAIKMSREHKNVSEQLEKTKNLHVQIEMALQEGEGVQATDILQLRSQHWYRMRLIEQSQNLGERLSRLTAKHKELSKNMALAWKKHDNFIAEAETCARNLQRKREEKSLQALPAKRK